MRRGQDPAAGTVGEGLQCTSHSPSSCKTAGGTGRKAQGSLGLTWVSRTQIQHRFTVSSGTSSEHRMAKARAKTRAEGEGQGCGGKWFLNGPPGKLLLLWPSGRYLSAQLSTSTLLRVLPRLRSEGRVLTLLIWVSSSKPSPAPSSCRLLSLCPQRALEPGGPGGSSVLIARLRGAQCLTTGPP